MGGATDKPLLAGKLTSLLRRWLPLGPKEIRSDESLGPARAGEVRPPWIEYPGFGPGDGFWRQSGEYFFSEEWRPYYDSLSSEQQAEYLKYWEVPPLWRDYYFDPEWQEFLEHVDDPE